MNKPKVYYQYIADAPYQSTWALQESLLQEIVAIKLQKNPAQATPNYLIFCEHPHVYTLGKSGHEENLLLTESQLEQVGATFIRNNRGGDITYHGKGQLVGYPIFDLAYFKTDLHWYMRALEEAIILVLADFGLKGERIEGLTGVWLDSEKNPRKICALGVRCSRWVTMHGFAFNLNTDLQYFEYIVPCGIQDKGVTSLANELQQPIEEEMVRTLLLEKIAQVFDCEIIID